MKGPFFLTTPLALAALLAGCKTDGNRAGPYRDGSGYGDQRPRGEVTVTPGSAAGFLSTGYQPLENWMDERFRVRYENMPLNLVFEQKPISDIKYQFQNLPANAPLFFLVSPSISRRELLKEISKTYGLDMRIEMVNGQPGFVIVTGRGPVSGLTPQSAPAGLLGQAPAAIPAVPSAQAPSTAPILPPPFPSQAGPSAPVEEATAVPLAPGVATLQMADRGAAPAANRY